MLANLSKIIIETPTMNDGSVSLSVKLPVHPAKSYDSTNSKLFSDYEALLEDMVGNIVPFFSFSVISSCGTQRTKDCFVGSRLVALFRSICYKTCNNAEFANKRKKFERSGYTIKKTSRHKVTAFTNNGQVYTQPVCDFY